MSEDFTDIPTAINDALNNHDMPNDLVDNSMVFENDLPTQHFAQAFKLHRAVTPFRIFRQTGANDCNLF